MKATTYAVTNTGSKVKGICGEEGYHCKNKYCVMCKTKETIKVLEATGIDGE